MEIESREIRIRDVVDGYVDNEENGVVGYGGRLDIRPPFQREFIYNDKQRDEVIRTIKKGFPLNVMYWAKNDEGNYELMDGQQRTISFCQYYSEPISVDGFGFNNLTEEEQQKFLDYKLTIYICEGTKKEKIDWFEVINIAGEELTHQELLNAILNGEWVNDAKRYFSKRNCPAYGMAAQYLKGSAIRQDYLETAIRWVSNRDGVDSRYYMELHQHDTNCNEIWLYFQAVINWVKAMFPVYRKEMKGVEWGILYNKYGSNNYDPQELENRISLLMMDDDIAHKAGIYEYIFDGEEKHLNIRAFSPSMKRSAYEKQKGICPRCGRHFEIDGMEADHITPWSKGGKTTADNCQMLCMECNRRKSNI